MGAYYTAVSLYGIDVVFTLAESYTTAFSKECCSSDVFKGKEDSGFLELPEGYIVEVSDRVFNM